MKKVIIAAVCSVAFVSMASAAVKIGGNNSQKVTVQNGAIANMAIGPAAKAEQNIASNDGK